MVLYKSMTIDMYIYSRRMNNGGRFRITTPQLGHVGSVCVHFYYHMSGGTMGELELYRQGGSNYTTTHVNVWSMADDQGEDWKRASIDVELTTPKDMVSVVIRDQP